MTGISDHLIKFTVLEAFNNNLPNQPKFYKDWKNFNANNFALEFNDVNWNELMAIEMKDPNHSLINSTLNSIILLINMYQLKDFLKSNLNVEVSLG